MRSKRQIKVPQKLVDSNYSVNNTKPNSHKTVSKKEKRNVTKENIGVVGEGAKCDEDSMNKEELETTVIGNEEGEKIEVIATVVNEEVVKEAGSKEVPVVNATDDGKQEVNKETVDDHVNSTSETNVNKSSNGMDKGGTSKTNNMGGSYANMFNKN